MASKVRGAGGVFEDDAVVIALTIPLGFGAISAHRSFFTTLDATFSTCCFAISGCHQSPKCHGGTDSDNPSSFSFWKLSGPVEAHS
jgi:hypothetical protein